MSKTTIRKRISLVAVTALTAGVLSVVSAPVASANTAGATINTAPAADVLIVAPATGNQTGGAVVQMTPVLTGAAAAATLMARSNGLLYKDTSSTTAQTATVLNTGALALYTLSTASTNTAFVATGGSFGTTLGDMTTGGNTWVADTGYIFDSAKRTLVVTSGSTATGIAVSWSTTTAGTYTISSYVSSDAANIGGVTTATSGTLVGQVTVTVTASTAGSGTVSAAYSTCLTDENSGAIARTADSTASPSNGSPWYIKYILRDSYLSEISSSGNLVATATNSALLSIGSGTQAAGTTSTVVAYGTGAAGSAYDALRIDQPTAGAPLTTTVTLTFNGVTVCTKTVTIAGAPDKMIIQDIATGDIGGTTVNGDWLGVGATTSVYAAHYRVLLTDSAGNIATAAATTDFSADSATVTTTVTALAITQPATSISSSSAHRFSYGTFTCGPTAGTSTVTLKYTNPSTGKIITAPLKARCADNPYTYTVGLDKASYRQGEIGTMTIKFLDSKGNPANSTVAVGASSILLPMLTLVSATGAANVLTDANGDLKYTFTVGTSTGLTAGTYSGIVDFTALTAVAATKATPTYTVTTGGDTTSNADILKSIVALIASINKQIQALQKLILRR